MPDLKKACWFVACFAVIILLVINKANGLKCYSCASENSFDECHGRIKEYECPEDFTRCLKAKWSLAIVGDISDGYILGCARPTRCTAGNYTECNEGSGRVTCEINCCREDLCNQAVPRILSGLAVFLPFVSFMLMIFWD
ncbi:uncharacterized protein LOC5519440 [Nematostella vectensis]|uniref:uncharacterized protein LOC5519440 n=1 Tax=Nematostella vectensis TaxID=45351 RepID=UPI00207725E2|nr:uncharacterized protein LOC5519440 [Nematostella vectensis]